MTGLMRSVVLGVGAKGGVSVSDRAFSASSTAAAGMDAEVRDAPEAFHVELTGRRQPWPERESLDWWSLRLVVLDCFAASIAILTALAARFGLNVSQVGLVDYRFLAVLLLPAWLVTMTLGGTYAQRNIAAGAEQYRRVLNGTVWLLAAVAFASFALRAEISRGFVFTAIPYAAGLTLVGRYIARSALHRQFAHSRAAHRVLAVGSASEVRDLIVHLHRAANVGFRVVAAVTPGELEPPTLPGAVTWAGASMESVFQRAQSIGADTIAIAGPHLLARGSLRRLSWELEGSDIELVVAPEITDIAGPRVRITPIEGLPLLCIEKPQFSGVRRVFKESVDRVGAVLLLLLLWPLYLGVAVAVRLSSPGPILFKHRRVGLRGQEFDVYKFRTMRTSAEGTPAPALNDQPAGFFKIQYRDPRVTPVGRWLRRFSLDELPQVWNVVRGDMSLVGPRPLVAGEGDGFGSDVQRRLLVKPGMTGLWQVNGRSDLAPEERVRLDLYYVDHWSVGLDFVLLWKTFASVVRGRGAY